MSARGVPGSTDLRGDPRGGSVAHICPGTLQVRSILLLCLPGDYLAKVFLSHSGPWAAA